MIAMQGTSITSRIAHRTHRTHVLGWLLKRTFQIHSRSTNSFHQNIDDGAKKQDHVTSQCQAIRLAVRRNYGRGEVNELLNSFLSYLSAERPTSSTQTAVASLLHELFKYDLHDELDLVVTGLENIDYELRSGIRTTVLNSLMARQRWVEAVSYLEDLKSRYTLKHARMYPDLIEGLAKSGDVSLALHYFREMQSLEMKLSTTKVRGGPPGHLTELLKADTEVPRKVVSQSDPDMEMLGKNLEKTCLGEVIQYLSTWNLLCSDSLAASMENWCSAHPVFKFTARRVHGQADRDECPRCGHLPNRTESASENFEQVEEYLREYCKQLLFTQKYNAEISSLNAALHGRFHFDFIVDGSNIGLRTEKHEPRRLFRTDVLEAMVDAFHNTGKRVVVLLLHSMLRRSGVRTLSFLDSIAKRQAGDLISFVQLRHLDDDLAMIYLTIMSEYFLRTERGVTDPAYIVTNDSLVNQRFIFPVDMRSQFLRWVRQRQCRWSVHKAADGGRTFELTAGSETVSGTRDGGYHIACADGSVLCIART